MSARKRVRTALSVLLATGLVASGALLTAPDAYAEEVPTSEPVSEQSAPPEAPSEPAPESTEPAPEPKPEPAPDPAPESSSKPADEPAPAEAPETAEPKSSPASPATTSSADAAGVEVSAEVSDVAEGKLTVAARAEGVTLRENGDDVPDTGEPDAGVYFAVIEKGTSADLEAGEHGLASAFVWSGMIRDGVAAGSVEVEADVLDRSKEYEVYSWRAHGALTPERLVGSAPLEVTAEQWDAVYPPDEEPELGSFEWGVREKFRDYVRGPIAQGAITVKAPASGKNIFKFPQISGGSWNAGTQTGSVQFAGNVNFSGHHGALNLNLNNPTLVVKNARTAELSAPHGPTNKLIKIATLDLSNAQKATLDGGAVRYTSVPVSLTEAGAKTYFEGYLSATDPMDNAAFTLGAEVNVKPVEPPKTTPKPPKKHAPRAVGAAHDGQAAGSLRWGVSSQFAAYTTDKSRPGGRSGGKILTSGVGGGRGGYVFPQASGGSWNTESQTGTVRFSGVVTFTAHGGAMSESFANPVITVTSGSRGTLSAGGHTFGLNLGAGSKSVGSNGEVTWSGVPVSGSISGSGGGGGGSFGADPVTFTVGAASGVNYGSTSVEADTGKREPAATPPATTGIQVLTPEEDLVPGGEIEFTAPGFESAERDILVVLYSDPIVLDEAAGANADGTVRWIGNLPEDIDLGEHTITLQGESYDAGAVIEVVDPEEKQDRAAVTTSTASGQVPATVAGAAPFAGAPMWVWWASAIGLLVLAGATTTLVVAQRRK